MASAATHYPHGDVHDDESILDDDDRRAPQNTIDETVWATLSRDLLAVWEKLRQVLWPKYLLGGMLQRGGGGMGAAERGEATGFGGGMRNMIGRWPDADTVLQGGMSEGLRDWDLWCVVFTPGLLHCMWIALTSLTSLWQGPSYFLLAVDSFFQSVCIIGYTLFPLVIAALLSALGLPTIARIPVYLVLVAWSLAAGVSILGGSGVVRNRVGIAVYPLFVFYIAIGCLCFIS
ncbi:conserved hypothetical protein [Aspergillus terreus NIH2624]|uniref:Protein YIP n=1 Tax=Aspergillus terreus (strain NIH 2624 / FGSC A1156) TaxID=341663 RepID=Q0CXT7_ASPTN|nr:uncharacterized protein ATEG_01497 [Aspergillus terreus NIH2624]EAU38254.1 conserved hypothetical protein [Aspergillus terreus NIH2624]